MPPKRSGTIVLLAASWTTPALAQGGFPPSPEAALWNEARLAYGQRDWDAVIALTTRAIDSENPRHVPTTYQMRGNAYLRKY
jgi:hypothetical protein